MKPQARRNGRTQGCICIRSIGDRDALSRPQCPLVPNAPPSCHPQGSNVTLLHADLRRRTMSRIVYRLLFVFLERIHPLPVSVHWVKTRVQNMKTNCCVFIERSHTLIDTKSGGKATYALAGKSGRRKRKRRQERE